MKVSLAVVLLLTVTSSALADRAKRPARSKIAAFLFPKRYHLNAHGRHLVGLDWSGRVQHVVRQRRDGNQVRAVYGSIAIDGRAHPFKHSVLIRPGGQASHRLVVKGLTRGEVGRLRAASFEGSSAIRAGTMVHTWNDRQPFHALTDARGAARVVAGSLPFKVGVAALGVSLVGVGAGAPLAGVSFAEALEVLVATGPGQVLTFGLGGGYGVIGQLTEAAPQNIAAKMPRRPGFEVPPP
jgi:hypothetical protein